MHLCPVCPNYIYGSTMKTMYNTNREIRQRVAVAQTSPPMHVTLPPATTDIETPLG